MPAFGPGMKASLAEQYSVSPAKTQGLALALGRMFFGRTARRWLRSFTATPVNSICAPSGRLETSMVALAGCVPKLKAAGIQLVHDPLRNLRGEVGVYENHMAQLEARSFHHRLYPVKRQADLD